MSADLLFGRAPYLALAVLGTGAVVRYALCVSAEGRRQRLREPDRHHLQEDQQKRAGFALFGTRRLWRVAWMVLLGAHLLSLVFPNALLRWNEQAGRLYVFEGVGLLLGLASFCGWLSAVWRHLGSRPSLGAGRIADSMFLSVLMLGVVTGLLMAVRYRWASSWGAVTLTPYVRSLMRGLPEPALVAELPFLARLHLFSGFAALALLPFTRIAPHVLLPVHRALAFAVRPLLSLTTGVERWLQRHSPARFIWPDEEYIGVSLLSKRREARREARKAARASATGGAAPRGPETVNMVPDVADPAPRSAPHGH